MTVDQPKYKPSDEVDFVIVGSGAAGGILAKELSTNGFRVVVLEQGPYLTEADFTHNEIEIFAQDKLTNHPKLQPTSFRKTLEEKAKAQRALMYGRCVGGTSVHFTANFWRFHEIDFIERSKVGPIPGANLVDWPVTYADLEPYYTKVEWEIGVSGLAGSSPFDPPRSKPYPMPPLPVKSSGVLFERAARKLGWHPFPAPMAILSQARPGRSACVQCGYCLGFGCEVGKNLMFNTYSSVTGVYEHPLNDYKGYCVSRVLHDFYELDHHKLGFCGGGGLDARYEWTPVSFAFGAMPPETPRWGKDFKATLAHNFSRTMEVSTHGTSLPAENNSFSLDPDMKDAWGLPGLCLTYKDHPDDLKLTNWLLERAHEVHEAAGAVKKWSFPAQEQQFGVHLLGTCRMGNDPKTSVINPDHRTHDVKNLFLCDGSSLVTSGRGQPTTTIMALAFRAADRITALAKRGEIGA